MKGFIERVYWWWMRRTSLTARIRGVDFVYVTAEPGGSAARIQNALEEALRRASEARGGFGELVGSHLRFVAAVNAKRGWVASHARGYVSSFPEVEVSSPHLLACRLVWAATIIRLSQDAFARGASRDMPAIRRAADEAQLRFLNQFPDPGPWIEYLHRIQE